MKGVDKTKIPVIASLTAKKYYFCLVLRQYLRNVKAVIKEVKTTPNDLQNYKMYTVKKKKKKFYTLQSRCN